MISEEFYEIWIKASDAQDLQTFEQECETELITLNNNIFPEIQITYFDLLTRPLHKISLLLKNENIRKQLRDINLHGKFPIYWSKLSESIYKASMKAKLLPGAECNLHLVLFNDRLPHTFTWKVLSYLSNNDLKNLNFIYGEK